jgi:hypothetical protein
MAFRIKTSLGYAKAGVSPVCGTVRNVRCTVLKLTLPFIVLPKSDVFAVWLALVRAELICDFLSITPLYIEPTEA